MLPLSSPAALSPLRENLLEAGALAHHSMDAFGDPRLLLHHDAEVGRIKHQ